MAIGRVELLDLYRKAGLEPSGVRVRSGAVTFEVMHASMEALDAALRRYAPALRRAQRLVDWDLDVGPVAEEACPHGGASFDAVSQLPVDPARSGAVVADVLDAWFPPAPEAVAAVRADLGWLLRASPPRDAAGLAAAIARSRGVPQDCVVPAAGSSPLIHAALLRWLRPSSRVLLVQPAYGEYRHVLERRIGCSPAALTASRAEGWSHRPETLRAALLADWDLVVVVNPCNPTGRHVARRVFEPMLAQVPATTRVWVDEAYVDWVPPGESLEDLAAASSNVVVCKSLSKSLALSGARVGYAVAPPHLARELRPLLPPWSVPLPAQRAAIAALEAPGYYADRRERTHVLRNALAEELRSLPGVHVTDGVANWLLVELPERGPTAAEACALMRAAGVYVRDASSTAPELGDRALRVSVTAPEHRARIVSALHAALVGASEAPVASPAAAR